MIELYNIRMYILYTSNLVRTVWDSGTNVTFNGKGIPYWSEMKSQIQLFTHGNNVTSNYTAVPTHNEKLL